MNATAIFQYTPHGWQFVRSHDEIFATIADGLLWTFTCAPENTCIARYGNRLSIQATFKSLPAKHGFCKPPHHYLFGG